MAFISKEELKTVIRDYAVNAITEHDDSIAEIAIDAAIEEVSSILTPNSKKEWNDGRIHYDVEAIFSATGAERNSLMVENTKVVALWHLIRLLNAGIIYEEAEARYDRCIKYLKDLAKGVINSRTLPRLTSTNLSEQLPFRSGSRKKFNHE